MNGFDEDDHDISERLHRLARDAQTGSAEPTADVRRGRARLRRRQALSVVGSSAAVVGVALGVAALVDSGGRAPLPVAGGGPSVQVSGSSPTATPTPTSSACPTSATPIDPLADPLQTPAIRAALTSYAHILAAHLDPAGRHLQTVPTGFTGNPQLPCEPGGHVELGTKLGWTSAGQRGQAMVFVSVTNDWADDQVHLAFDTWRPAFPPDQVVHAWTATSGGQTAVAIERADGTFVAIQTDQTFGNNTPVGVTGFGFTADQLLTTAADPAFTLPAPR